MLYLIGIKTNPMKKTGSKQRSVRIRWTKGEKSETTTLTELVNCEVVGSDNFLFVFTSVLSSRTQSKSKSDYTG